MHFFIVTRFHPLLCEGALTCTEYTTSSNKALSICFWFLLYASLVFLPQTHWETFFCTHTQTEAKVECELRKKSCGERKSMRQQWTSENDGSEREKKKKTNINTTGRSKSVRKMWRRFKMTKALAERLSNANLQIVKLGNCAQWSQSCRLYSICVAFVLMCSFQCGFFSRRLFPALADWVVCILMILIFQNWRNFWMVKSKKESSTFV